MKRLVYIGLALLATIIVGTGCNPITVDKQFVELENYIAAQNQVGIYTNGTPEYVFDHEDGQCTLSPSLLTFRILNNTAKKYFEVVLSAPPVVGELVDVETRSKGVGLSSKTTYKGMKVTKMENNLCFMAGGAECDYTGIIIAWIE